MNKTKLNLNEKLNNDELDLSMCDLDTVPVKEIALLGNKIRRLNLSFNNLYELPDDFIKLLNIRELDLSKNHLKSLPKNFGHLTNLKKLDLFKNNLDTLPVTFGELKSLQWLDLKDNPLNALLSKVAGDCSDEAQCKKCAINVLKFMKEVSIEEERRRQEMLKQQREENLKRKQVEEEESKRERERKKREKEERKRLLREIRAKESNEQESTSTQNTNTTQNSFEITKKRPKCNFLSFIANLFLTFILLTCILVIAISIYCENILKRGVDSNETHFSVSEFCVKYNFNLNLFMDRFQNILKDV